jgi:hypothetical protein
VQILNNPPDVTVSPLVQTVAGGTTTQIVVSRTGGDLTKPITVSVGLGLDGYGDPLAIWGSDYIITSAPGDTVSLGASGGTITFAANELSIPLTVTTSTDQSGGSSGSPGSGETDGFRLTVLSGGTSYVSGSNWSNFGQGGGGMDGVATADVRITSLPTSGGGSGGGSGSGSGTGTGGDTGTGGGTGTDGDTGTDGGTGGGSGPGTGGGTSPGTGGGTGPGTGLGEQGSSGEITGVVYEVIPGQPWYDSEDTVLAGVTVDLEDANGDILATTTSAANGSYEFSDLTSGVYQVVAVETNPDFVPYNSTGAFSLSPGQTLFVNVGVNIAGQPD